MSPEWRKILKNITYQINLSVCNYAINHIYLVFFPFLIPGLYGKTFKIKQDIKGYLWAGLCKVIPTEAYPLLLQRNTKKNKELFVTLAFQKNKTRLLRVPTQSKCTLKVFSWGKSWQFTKRSARNDPLLPYIFIENGALSSPSSLKDSFLAKVRASLQKCDSISVFYLEDYSRLHGKKT